MTILFVFYFSLFFNPPLPPQHALYLFTIDCILQTSKEDAEDRGSGDPSQRTLGIVSSHLTIGSGSARVAVQDHGGLERFRGSNAMDGALACPTAVYVVVISLTAQKPEQRKQIKYWWVERRVIFLSSSYFCCQSVHSYYYY